MSMARLSLFWSAWKNRLWFYPAVCSVLSVAAVIVAAVIDTKVPFPAAPVVDVALLKELLNVIATTMLTISTFSLSLLYAAFSFTSKYTSPRATQALVTDNKAHEAISTFIAAFIFALVAIIALGVDEYSDFGRLILLLEILVVLGFVILAFLRWLRTLSLFGRLDYVVERVENLTDEALRAWRDDPCLGCAPGPEETPPGIPLYAEGVGYVQDVDRRALESLAETLDATIHVRVRSGMRVHPALPVAVVSGTSGLSDAQRRRAAKAFPLGHNRIFARDPALGLEVLVEMAGRALGAHDPGTVIRVMDAVERVIIAHCGESSPSATDMRPAFSHLTLVPFQIEKAMTSAFTVIARNAEKHPELIARLRETLAAVAANCSGPVREAAQRHTSDLEGMVKSPGVEASTSPA